MDKIKTEIREIVYCRDDDKSFGDIFIYEPENVEEQKVGNLFIVGELIDLPRNCSYVVNLLASKIKKEFYSDTRRTSEEALEAGLMEANTVISDMAQQGNGSYISKLNMVCGTYNGNEFHVSQIGKVKSLLIRNGSASEIIKSGGSQPVSIERAFNNIASGKLSDGDLALFATPGLFKIFSIDDIKKLSKKNLDDFSNGLQEKIEEDEEALVSALIIKIGEKSQMSYTDISEEDGLVEETLADSEYESDTDEEEVIKEEESYEEYAEENQNIQENIEETENKEIELKQKEIKKVSLSDIIKEYEKIEGKETSNNNEGKDISSIMNRSSENNFVDLDEGEDGIYNNISEKVKNVFEKIKIKECLNKIRYQITKKEEYPSLPVSGSKTSLIKNRNVILLAAIVLIVLMGNNIKSNKEYQEEVNKGEDYQVMLQESQSKMDQAEVELISGSDKTAGSLLVEAKNIAEKIRDEYDELDEDAKKIIEKAQTEIDRIDLIERIENPDIIAYLDNDDPKEIVELNNSYYIIDKKSRVIYILNQENQNLEEMTQLDSDFGEITSANNLQDEKIIIFGSSKIASFTPETNKVAILSQEDNTYIKDTATYSKYVYMLSPENNQIYKTQESGSSLVDNSEWIKSGDIKNGVSIAIDQYIYILTSDGKIKKYFIGEEYKDVNNETFEIEQPLENVTNPDEIKTVAEKKYLYVLESDQDRILVYDKTTGNMIEQFTGENFKNIQDFSIDPEEKFLIVMTDKEVIKFSID